MILQSLKSLGTLFSMGVLSVGLIVLPAVAQDTAASPPDGIPDPSVATSLPEPLKSFGGLRPALAAHGITFQLNYIGDPLGNFSGGFRRGATYSGRLELVIDTDLEQAVGWKGATVHANGFQIHGEGLGRHNLGNIFSPSNIEALPATRLYEAWFEQKLLDNVISLRVGQQGADQEFFTTTAGGLYVNNTFGWPGLFSTNLPSGGPNYPLATPAARIKADINPHITFLAAVFNGDPAGPGIGDPQQRDPAGLNFRVQDPPLLIGEAQLKYGRDKEGNGLGGTIKVGAWYHLGRFADQRFGADRLSSSDPNSNGQPLLHRGNNAVYGAIEQQIYRSPGEDAAHGITIFARAAASPSDRNFASFYVDGGMNFTGLVPNRPNDAFGIAGAYLRVSDLVRALDADTRFFSGLSKPIRDYEGVLEITYSAVIVPGVTLQPTFQYIFHPGANAPDPRDPLGVSPIRNAAVFGVRGQIRY